MEYSTFVKNLSQFNQGILLLSAGKAGEEVKQRLLLRGWTSEGGRSQELLKVMSADASSPENGLEQILTELQKSKNVLQEF